MPKLHWDGTGEKLYEVGVDRGVLFTMNASTAKYNYGKAWNGLSAVNENPSGAEPTKVYADNSVYANIMSAEEYGATIEAYTCPREFYACDGMASVASGVYVGQQTRQKFAFSFRNKVGSDVSGDLGYKIHLVYNCVANPSSRDHGTINESPDLSPLSWEISTDTVEVAENMNKTAHIIIDSTEVDSDKLAAFEKILYGDDITPTAFSTTATYEVGDYVTYETKTYQCTTAVSVAGAWDATDWEEVEPESVGAPKLLLPAEVIEFFAEG